MVWLDLSQSTSAQGIQTWFEVCSDIVYLLFQMKATSLWANHLFAFLSKRCHRRHCIVIHTDMRPSEHTVLFIRWSCRMSKRSVFLIDGNTEGLTRTCQLIYVKAYITFWKCHRLKVSRFHNYLSSSIRGRVDRILNFLAIFGHVRSQAQ